MPSRSITLSASDLYEQLQAVCYQLLYPSETDAPIIIHRFPPEVAGKTFNSADLQKHFYPADTDALPVAFSSARMAGYADRGFVRFFHNLPNRLVLLPGNELFVPELARQDQVPLWRTLRDLIADNLINGRFYRVELTEDTRKDIYVAGQHAAVTIDAESNAVSVDPGDWFVLRTYVIET